jgi:hypothetical protein
MLMHARGLVVQVDQLLVATLYPCSKPEPEDSVHVVENQPNDDDATAHGAACATVGPTLKPTT